MSTINANSSGIVVTGNADGTLDLATGGTTRLTVTSGGNLNFAGTAQRITGDMSNATVANRLAFQNSVTNGSTQVTLFPNGTSQTSLVRVFNNSDPTNASTGLLYIDSVRVGLDSGITGTGTYLPTTFHTGGSERVRIDTSGNVGIGTASPSTYGAKLNVSSAGGAQSSIFVVNPGVGSGQIGFDAASSNFKIYNTYSDGLLANGKGIDIDQNGNVGVGGTAGTKFQVFNNNETVRFTPASGTTSTTATYGTFRNNGNVFYFGLDSSTGADFGIANAAVLWHSSANPIVFSTNNTERMRIDSSGNVGIGGTASAFDKVAVTGTLPTDSNASLNYSARGTAPSGTTSQLSGFNSYPATAAASFTCAEVSHFNAANLTIGAGSTVTNQIGFKANNTLTGATNNFGFYSNIASGSNRWNFYAAGTADNYFAGNTAIGGGIDANHRLKVENTGALHAQLSVVDDANYYDLQAWNKATSGDNKWISFLSDGGATLRGSIDYNRGGGLVRYNTTSDYRAKTVIGPVTNSGELVDALKVYVGKMNGATVERPMLIAHEAQEVAPYAVSGEKDAVDKDGSPVYQQIDVSSLVPLLIAEVKSLRQRVAELEAK